MNFSRSLLILILSVIYSSDAYVQELENKEDNPTDAACPTGWLSYKDERCLKVFETDYKTYEEAESLCKRHNEAHLVSVDMLEKQMFVEDLLRSKNHAKDLWLGLRDLDGNEWSDGTSLSFVHWKEHPLDRDANRCTQMKARTPGSDFGKWERESCNKKNVVVCEKVQLWTQERFQVKLMNSLRNPIPIDFVYVQLPKNKAPAEIWPGMVWEDISNEYDSSFFRVIGKASGRFNEVQEESFPTYALKVGKGSSKHKANTEDEYVMNVPVGEWSPEIEYQPYGAQQRYAQMMQVKKAVVPRNMAVKIWKRKY